MNTFYLGAALVTISLLCACNFQKNTDNQSVAQLVYKDDSAQAHYVLQKVKIAEAYNDSLAKDSSKRGKFQPMKFELPEISPTQRKHLRKDEPKETPTDSVPKDSAKAKPKL